jgi:DNA invertase Pin-like site-specific DNA recombinase
MAIFGYARVSTREQSLDAQIAELQSAGADRIFREKLSGKNRGDRPELTRALDALSAGDILVVYRLDRLARSSRDLLNIVHQVHAAGASFKSIKDAWADTSNSHGRLILTVLSGLAEFERELIAQRTGEGRERAMAEGVRFGRKPKLTPHQRREAIARRESGEETLMEIARSYNVSHTMIARLTKEQP